MCNCDSVEICALFCGESESVVVQLQVALSELLNRYVCFEWSVHLNSIQILIEWHVCFPLVRTRLVFYFKAGSNVEILFAVSICWPQDESTCKIG